ncbi:hypothetical protein Afil01_25060 [Actinorhabdospora filicis]|uniref:Uncharacterized protein n=1 Tax=Actinorhabdospora filicis TaxID=1785913 RepID=A0A9W6SIH0_9ACTN|nr:hypothetical protein [Actinorhabdospora filicis]GLZ77699.1 hypothetical protein Afil01_25060 [Actinorhabdospora filicis]
MVLTSTALRVVMMRVHLATGAVLAAVVLHDMVNVAEFAYPAGGSHFDPLIAGAVTIALAAALSLQRQQRRPDPSRVVAQ